MTNEQSNHILLQLSGLNSISKYKSACRGYGLTIPKRADTWAKNERNAAINATMLAA